MGIGNEDVQQLFSLIDIGKCKSPIANWQMKSLTNINENSYKWRLIK